MQLPLQKFVVFEYAEVPAAAWAGLRLAELGARVVQWHTATPTLSKGKERVPKEDQTQTWFNNILRDTDVLLCRKNDLDPEQLRIQYPGLIVVEFSAWGAASEHWKFAESDLLAQAISGLAYTTGSLHDLPTPFGYTIADYLCGNQAVQFVLAALFKRQRSEKGCLIQVSLIETLLDFQFEFLTTFFQSGKQPMRAAVDNANAILSAPYGIYATKDGHISIAMMPLSKLNKALECEGLKQFTEADAFVRRDDIKQIIAQHLKTATNNWWLHRAQQLDLWIMPVLNWNQLTNTDTYKKLRPNRLIQQWGTVGVQTTEMPIRFMKTE